MTQAPSGSVAGRLAGRHLLLTGVTGFVGEALLRVVGHGPRQVARREVVADGRRGRPAVERLEHVRREVERAHEEAARLAEEHAVAVAVQRWHYEPCAP